MTPAVEPPLPPLWTQHVDKPSSSYRAQTLLLDALAFASIASGFKRNELGGAEPLLIDTGVGLYLFGSPIAHTVHGRPAGEGLQALRCAWVCP